MYHLSRTSHFVVMSSVFDTDLEITSFWDLKGSHVNRRAGKGEDVKKDEDLREETEEGDGEAAFHVVDSEVRRRLRRALEADLDFFRDEGIIDYSMLVGVTDVPRITRAESHRSEDDRGGRADDGLALEVEARSDSANVGGRRDGGITIRGGFEAADCGGGPGSPGSVEVEGRRVAYFGIIDVLQQVR